jgi:glutamate dehydrogenase
MNWQEGKQRLLEQLDSEIGNRLPGDQSAAVAEFAAQYFQGFHSDDLKQRSVTDLYGMALGSWHFLQQHRQDQPKVRIFNPNYQHHGWQSKHTIVSILCRNMPFITDSIRGEINRRNITIHTIHSGILSVVRDADGQLVQLLPKHASSKPAKGCQLYEEALVFLEISRSSNLQQMEDGVETLQEVLQEVAMVVDDFKEMSSRAHMALVEIAATPGLSEPELEEYQNFFSWLCDRNYTFLGYEELQVSYDNAHPSITRVKGSELGLLRQRSSLAHIELYNSIVHSQNADELLQQQLVFSKSSVRCRVHRLVYPDYVGLKRFDREGRVIGEHRFLGLFTSPVYTMSPMLIPVVRQKVAEVIARSGLRPESHEGKDLAHVFQVFPRDELFQSSVDELFETAISVNKIQERKQTRLFVRRDRSGKFVNCLVYLPRYLYHTELRQRIEATLIEAFNAQESDFTTYFSESILVRTHFVLRVDPTDKLDINLQALEEELAKVTTTWQEHLKNYLHEEFGEEQGAALNTLYATAFSPGYTSDFDPQQAVDDIKRISELQSADDIAMNFYRIYGEADNQVRFRLFHLDHPVALSDVMPVLENLGLRVIGERPYDIKRGDKKMVWVHEFSLLYSLADHIDVKKIGEDFQEAFSRIWFGDAESDGFNRLILGAHLDWREIALLRAYAHYMKQIQFNFSNEYIADTLCNHLSITRSIVELFNLRFDPQHYSGPDDSEVLAAEKTREQAIIESLESVENLSEDRIIRHYLALINATVRSNYFQRDAIGQCKKYFSFKFMPMAIPEMPLPSPMFEIFVYSPRVEGVHLRGGKVARGGLRWSDRHEDFRTEVLGLVKAQQVKNAVIVPTGAKGGFVAKKLPVDGGRDAFMAEGISCYQTFIQGLLDITDNLVEGAVIPPQDVVRKDEDDPYLVVAADKGTATFSDIANELSEKAGFWLGDAFASGGSVGYDHKKMGITARGAWVSVQRHFREMGINVQQEDFTVVGIGDMGGDVFGNGMLLSEHIQLTAAFNHMHIFVDPCPDAAKSYIERKRLFELPGSSWEDYAAELISEGGGVFKRSAKSVAISPQMKARFAIEADKLTPNELISALLKAPVDLIWNGGIGTYVKASSESHAEVGDKANDVLRVNADELQCQVIGEGGNLGMTQLARVEYSLNGGRMNTDFIDNAAGVDCSDHEVNIKILLNSVVATGDMTVKQRNQLLESMTNSVAELVLDNNYRQTQALSIALREAVLRNGEYRRLIAQMESSGRLNRQLEFIPSDEVLVERRALGKGLTRPELSILISYAKSELKQLLVDSDLPDDNYIAGAVETAFPDTLRSDFKAEVYGHQLNREIIATQVANDLFNHGGITFVDRIAQTTGANATDVARAYVVARDVFDIPHYWQQIEDLDYRVNADTQMKMMSALIRLTRRASRWFIRNRRSTLEPAQAVEQFKSTVQLLAETLPGIVKGELASDMQERSVALLEEGVPESLALYVSSEKLLYPLLGIIEAADEVEGDAAKVAEVFFALGYELELDWFAKQIANLKIDNHWQALARESYRDDLEWQLRNLTVGAMRHLCAEGLVEDCIASWLEQQSMLIERWRAMLTELQGSDTHDFAMYSVAIRELLDMAQRSKFDEMPAACTLK